MPVPLHHQYSIFLGRKDWNKTIKTKKTKFCGETCVCDFITGISLFEGPCQSTDISSTIRALCVILLGIWCMLDKYDLTRLNYTVCRIKLERQIAVISHFRGIFVYIRGTRICAFHSNRLEMPCLPDYFL